MLSSSVPTLVHFSRDTNERAVFDYSYKTLRCFHSFYLHPTEPIFFSLNTSDGYFYLMKAHMCVALYTPSLVQCS